MPPADSCTLSSECIMCFFQGQLSHLEPSQDDGRALAVLCHSCQGKGLYRLQRGAGSLGVLYEAQEGKSVVLLGLGFVLLFCFLTVLDTHTRLPAPLKRQGRSSLPLCLHESQRVPPLGFALYCPSHCSVLRALSMMETIRASFHCPFLHVCTSKRESHRVGEPLSP